VTGFSFESNVVDFCDVFLRSIKPSYKKEKEEKKKKEKGKRKKKKKKERENFTKERVCIMKKIRMKRWRFIGISLAQSHSLLVFTNPKHNVDMFFMNKLIIIVGCSFFLLSSLLFHFILFYLHFISFVFLSFLFFSFLFIPL
jgi:hypothetical protein